MFEFPEDVDAPAAEAAADVDVIAGAADEDASEAPLDTDAQRVPGVPTAGRDRLELAIAYLDLGDAETARTLLQEVAVGADPHSQAQARELLARLG